MLFSLFQKAGFLYLEESFSKDDKVFRRRVVLAVSVQLSHEGVALAFS